MKVNDYEEVYDTILTNVCEEFNFDCEEIVDQIRNEKTKLIKSYDIDSNISMESFLTFSIIDNLSKRLVDNISDNNNYMTLLINYAKGKTLSRLKGYLDKKGINSITFKEETFELTSNNSKSNDNSNKYTVVKLQAVEKEKVDLYYRNAILSYKDSRENKSFIVYVLGNVINQINDSKYLTDIERIVLSSSILKEDRTKEVMKWLSRDLEEFILNTIKECKPVEKISIKPKAELKAGSDFGKNEHIQAVPINREIYYNIKPKNKEVEESIDRKNLEIRTFIDYLGLHSKMKSPKMKSFILLRYGFLDGINYSKIEIKEMLDIKTNGTLNKMEDEFLTLLNKEIEEVLDDTQKILKKIKGDKNDN